jgi:hypothetical protein
MRYFCKNMLLKRSLLTYFFITSLFCVKSQENRYPLSQQACFKFLWNPRFNGCRVEVHRQPGFRFIDFKTSKWKNYPQQLIIENNRLYIQLMGAGIVYGSILDETGKIAMQRLDSTEHFGYNINSYTFSARNKLMNIGGYGMWRWNGQLRVFEEATRGWEIEPLSEEYPLSNELPGLPIWVSPDKKRLLSLGYLTGNQAIQGKENQHVNVVPEIIELDLVNYKWSQKGHLKSSVYKWIKPEFLIMSLDEGLLFSNFGPYYLLDLNTFETKALVERDFQNILSSKIFPAVNWNKGNSIYFANFQTGKIDSITFKPSFFQSEGESVFEKPKLVFQYKLLFSILLLGSAIGGLMYWKKMSSDKILKVAANTAYPTAELISPYEGMDIFDAVEQALLHLLISNVMELGKRTGTEEVNRVLGVAMKSHDMQKRKRSDVIRSINAKYKLIHPAVNKPLVERVKSEMDARLFEYSLLQEEIENVTNILKSS